MSSSIRVIDGFVYVPDSDSGVFAGAARGMVLRKPDRSPPWIVVDHAIESAVIARWPGRLWRVVVLDADGVEDEGWFLGIHCFTNYVKVAFFRGASLRPLPPGTSKSKDTRYLDIYEDDQLDEAQLAAWVKQASQLPGERM